MTIAATEPKRLYASTAREIFTSNDLGDTWEPLGIKEKWPLPYARGIAVKADDPGVLFAGCGETTTGETGRDGVSTNSRHPGCAIRPSRPFQDIGCSSLP